MLNTRVVVLVTAIFLAAIFRLVPHPPNFSPIAAMALFSGAYLPRRGLAFVAPMGAMLVSDAVLGFHGEMLVVYASVAMIVAMGFLLSAKRSAGRIVVAALASSVLFYLVTNFGVWASGDMYPKTAGGLAACYAAAIPFFQNSLIGDLVFTGLLFGGFAVAERLVPTLRNPAELRAA
nr:DUF6580 family putative transport protein [uncultured Sphingosinicella sp.]